MIDWLASTNDGIEALRQENKPQTESQKDIWRQYSSDNYMQAQAASNEGPDACTYQGQTSISIETKNLNTARWAQTGSGYNDNIAMSCPSNSGGKAPVGCVANAVGIIMKYYQYPSQYNWSSMFDNAGSSETARLLADLGTSSNLDNSYGCDGSSASMNRVVPTLADHGYYNASLSNYSYTTVHNEIYNNRPVILSGGKRSNWWVFYYYDDGHAWVADGYRDTHYYECRQNPYNPSQWEKVKTTTTTQFWMNWGWGGMHNGWYMNNNFNPGGYTFNYTPKMVTNIHP